MKRSKFTDAQILAIVKEGEAGRKLPICVARMAAPSRRTTAGRTKRGGMELSETQRLKKVEDEDRRLMQIVAEQLLGIQALKLAVEQM